MNFLLRLLAAAPAALALGCAVLSAADGENENNAAYDGPRVVLFERPNFRGESIEVRVGEEIPNLGNITFPDGSRANDAVSSIYIEPGAVVVANSDARFRGESLRLTQSVENLDDLHRGSDESWTDAISSVRVDPAPVVLPPRRGGGAREDREPRAILYREPDFRGEFLEVFPGENYDNLNDVSFDGGGNANDRISSIRIIGGVKLRAWSSSGYHEDALEVTEDVPELGKLRRGAGGSGTWSDCISSLRVERGPNTPDTRGDTRDRGGYSRRDRDAEPGGYDNRPRPGRDSAAGNEDNALPARPGQVEVLISRVFREMLSRAPTEIEVREYRSHVLDDGWNEQMIRDDIRQTREYRQHDADVVIIRSYQDLLGRRPNSRDLDDCRELVVEQGYSEQQLRERIQRSPEFRERRRRDADAMITRAYQDLLGRRPDPEGLQHYRELVVDRGFSEQQIRDRIRDSDEFHQHETARVDAIITRAYRELLGRDPDADGLQHRRHAMLEEGQTEKQMRDAIKKSDEYRARQAELKQHPPPAGQPPPSSGPRPN